MQVNLIIVAYLVLLSTAFRIDFVDKKAGEIIQKRARNKKITNYTFTESFPRIKRGVNVKIIDTKLEKESMILTCFFNKDCQKGQICFRPNAHNQEKSVNIQNFGKCITIKSEKI